MKKNFYQLTLLILIIYAFITLHQVYEAKQEIEEFSFLVAGHTYGAHTGTNQGLYPKFLQHLKDHQNHGAAMIILTGDTVRKSIPQSWDRTIVQLKRLNIPFYLVMGNHDSSIFGRKVFDQFYGNSYYAFDKFHNSFIILDTQQKKGRFPKKQLEFLEQKIKAAKGVENFFIFFHELVWTAQKSKYNHIVHNYASYNKYFTANFWNDLVPILKQYPDKQFYIFAGDLGAHQHSIPAFYEEVDNMTLIASGMGEIQDENYILVTVHGSKVEFKLIPLNPSSTLAPLKTYTPDYFLNKT